MRCKRCHVEKDIAQFQASELRPNKGSQWCRDCVREYKRVWKEKRRRAAGVPKKVFKSDLQVAAGVYRCLRCLIAKPLADFSASAMKPKGRAWCRPCVTEHVRPGNHGHSILVRSLAKYRASGKAKITNAKWRRTDQGRLVLRELVMRRRAKLKSSTKPKEMRLHYERLLVLQRGLCAACKEVLKKFHVDHIVPLALGGAHEPSNLQLLCPPCNRSKHAKDPVRFMQEKGYLL